MSLTNLNKFVTAFVVLVFITFIGSIGYAAYYVNTNGGVKQTIIELGKDAKEIGQAIGKG